MKKALQALCLVLTALFIILIPATSLAQGDEPNLGEDVKQYLSYTQFRGNTLVQGLIDSKTPINSDQIEEKWAASFGAGWNSTPGTPIVVGDYLYVVVPGQSKLNRVSLETGEVVKSVDCPGSSQFFSTIAYSDGLIFVPRSKTIQVPSPTEDNPDRMVNKYVAVVYAYDEVSMEKLWETEPIGSIDDMLQPLSAVTCYHGYIYIGVSNARADKGAFACFDMVDYDLERDDEAKPAVWSYQPEDTDEKTYKKGYYWSGGAIVNNAIVFGGEATELVIHSLTEDKVYDRILLVEDPQYGIRSTVHYDKGTNRVYVTTKSGYIYSIKINGDNTFDRSSLISRKLGDDITSSPVVFKGRLYIGGGGIMSSAGFSVLDAETLEIIYQISDVKTQASPIITTHYATKDNDYQVYIYVTKYEGYVGSLGGYAPDSSCVYQIVDKQGQTEPDYSVLITPSILQYCTQSIAIDGNGTMYYYNDGGRIFALGHKDMENAKFTAQDVVNGIELMESEGEVTLRNEYTVKRLLTRYRLLTPEEQAKIHNFDKLEEALERLELLKDEVNLVDELSKFIEFLDVDKVTLGDEDAIAKYLAMYNSLTDDSKALVQDIATLNQAVEKLEDLKNQKMIDEINKKIDELPQLESVVYSDKEAIYDVANLVNNQNDAVKEGVNNEKLNLLKEKVDNLEALLKTLDEDIFNRINPLNIGLKDKETVEELRSRYDSLNEEDKAFIENYEDLLFAEKVINGLEANKTVIPEVFRNMFGNDVDYKVEVETYDGFSYSVTFNGLNITNPELSFNFEISTVSQNTESIRKLAEDAYVISFAHNGDLPGEALVELEVDLEDGTYILYYFDEASGKAVRHQEVTVVNGRTQFTITHCSDYFISAESDLESVQDDQDPDEDESDNDNVNDDEAKDDEKDNENEDGTDSPSPKTGDNTRLAFFTILVIASIAIGVLTKKYIRG